MQVGVSLRNVAHTLGQVAEAPVRLHDFFKRSVQRYPNNIAIEVPAWDNSPKRTLSYHTVDDYSSQLAAYLSSRIKPEAIVAILLPRSDERLYIAQLAAMMAGGAYLCIDPSFPADRLRFTLEDAQAQLVITDDTLRSRVEEVGVEAAHIVDYDEWFRLSQNGTPSIPPVMQSIRPEQLAYIIYTSGTTGRPKGVMVEHRNIATLLNANDGYFELGPTDRVLQNSSTSYDSSVEETYLAFAFGGTLVVGRDEIIRLGPDLGPWLHEQGITVFCPPPTLLRTIGGPDASAALTRLRLLYVGGEAVTSDIVDTWAPGRWMENGYGPTECAVTITRTRLFADGEVVSIGYAVSGNNAWILTESGALAEDDEKGELCISGPSVARGYLGRPELTATRFPEHPICGRIYRTGDLVSRRPDGKLLFHGRIDTQVKLRGYRIELGEIESQLTAMPGIESAACVVRGGLGREQLVAFIVSGREHAVSLSTIKEQLGAKLPSYMVPAHFVELDQMPTTTSGKLDRKALPAVETEQPQRTITQPPTTHLETVIARAISSRLELGETICIDEDFFELGGDSLSAALVISELRSFPETSALAMRDMYEKRTVRRLAAGLENTTMSEAVPSTPRQAAQHPFLANVIMVGFVCIMGLLASAVAYAVGFKLLPFLLDSFSVLTLLVAAPVLALLSRFVWFVPAVGLAVATKKLLIGTYETGVYPVWGAFFIRHWLVKNAANLVPWRLVKGTELEIWALRKLGAQIGDNVHIHKGVNLTGGGWDLLSIGDNATLGRDVSLRMVDVAEKSLFLGPVCIERDAVLETRAGVMPGGRVERGAFVTPLSIVGEGQTAPAGKRWHGVPGKVAGDVPERPDVDDEQALSVYAYTLRFFATGVMLDLVAALPFIGLLAILLMALGIDSASVAHLIYGPSIVSSKVIALCSLWVVVSYLLRLPLIAFWCRLIGRVQPGVYHRRSITFIRVWYKDACVTAANRWLSGTLFWPSWLRLAGMKVGPDSEISTIMEVVPELVSIEGSCFFADGIYLGGPKIQRGVFYIDHVKLSRGTFIGNHSVIPSGAGLPSNILLGICTLAEPAKIRENSSWFGHPCFELPRREIVECDVRLTHRPAWYRYLNRLMCGRAHVFSYPFVR